MPTLCTEPDHVILSSRLERGLYWKPKEWEKHRAKVLSRPLSIDSILEKVKFYAGRDILKLKYGLMMCTLEEKVPSIYGLLTSIGLPKPFQ